MMTPMPKDKKIFTVLEFAEELGIPPSSIRRWLTNGNLRGTKMGKKWLIPSSEINRLVDPPQRKKSS